VSDSPEEKKRPKFRTSLTFLIIFSIIALVGWLFFRRQTVTELKQEVAAAEATVPKLEVLDYKATAVDSTRYVIGTVRNNSGRTIEYAQVEINLYDKSGAQVGSTMDNVTNIEPRGTWKFKAMITEESATNFKIVGVTGH
jgi:hypothetical protein